MEFGLSPIPGFLFLCPFLRFGSARTQFPAAPNFFIFSPSSSGVSAALLFFFRTALFPSELFFFLPSCCLPSEVSGALLPFSFAFFPRLLFFAPFSRALFFFRASFPARLFSAPPFPHAFFSRLLSRALSFPCASSRAPLSARPLFARLAPSFPAYTLPGLNPLPSLSILQPAPRLNGTAADGTVRNGALMSAQSFSVPLQAHPGRFMLPNC